MTDSQETARKIRQKTVGTSLRVSCPNGCGTTAAPLRNGVAAPEDALSAEKHGGAADVRSINRFRLSNESLFSVCALGASWVDGNHATERFILKPLRRVCHVRHADYHHLLDLPARFHRYRGVRHRQIQSLVFLPPVWKGPARHRLRGAFCVRRRSDAVRTTAKRGLARSVLGTVGPPSHSPAWRRLRSGGAWGPKPMPHWGRARMVRVQDAPGWCPSRRTGGGRTVRVFRATARRREPFSAGRTGASRWTFGLEILK